MPESLSETVHRLAGQESRGATQARGFRGGLCIGARRGGGGQGGGEGGTAARDRGGGLRVGRGGAGLLRRPVVSPAVMLRPGLC